MRKESPLLFERSREGKAGYSLPACDVPAPPAGDLLPAELRRRRPPVLPQLSEGEVIRHYTDLSRRNHGVDSGFYPLGSCTMKYNPKAGEEATSLPGFALLHPCQEEETVQGALELMYNLEQALKELTGMDRFTFQPAAGAHGELTGLMVSKAYFKSRREERDKVLVPDSAHGTNPASAAMVGFQVVQVPSNARGLVDREALRRLAGPDTAVLMLTNPNTLGLFEAEILDLARIVHDAGGLLYYDGANLNAVMGYARPRDMGFDLVHLNLHKTFATPHGGGGPGSGPLGVSAELEPFLPAPLVVKEADGFRLDFDRPDSIGQVHSFYGNFGVLVKAYTYIRLMGGGGLRQAAADAVLNANYLMHLLQEAYTLPYAGPCKHEFVLSARRQKKAGAGAGDIAKALLDYGIHPPTVYFPLIVEEALMIEPTETESKETLDRFVEVMQEIARLAEEAPARLKEAPHTTVVGRLDETLAARRPRLRWQKDE